MTQYAMILRFFVRKKAIIVALDMPSKRSHVHHKLLTGLSILATPFARNCRTRGSSSSSACKYPIAHFGASQAFFHL